jgi:SOS-response transcriptional repressor LexA
MDLRDRIRERLQTIRKSARRASIDGGLTPDAIRNVLRSKSVNPRRDTLQGIARGLDWSLEKLLDLPSADASGASYTQIHRIPLLSWARAADLWNTSDPDAVSNIDNRAGFVAVATSQKALIALRVTDSSMNRIAPKGSVIIVDIGDKLFVAGRYFVFTHGNQTAFRRYRLDPFRLEPDSTDSHDTIFSSQNIRVVGHVIQVINDLP